MFLRLATLMLIFASMSAAQVPEGGTAGKVDRSKSLRPIETSDEKAPAEKKEPAPPKVASAPSPAENAVDGRAMDIVIEAPAKPAPRRGFLIESTVMKPKVFFPIEGAEKTVLAAAYEWEYGIKTYKKEEWEEIDAKSFAEESIQLADHLLESTTPRFVRNNRDVIEYAILNSEDPFISSVLISKNFVSKFEDKLGDHIHALVIDRKAIYLFPATGGQLESFAGALLEQYNDTLEPVSLEVFSVTKDGYKVIGNITP